MSTEVKEIITEKRRRHYHPLPHCSPRGLPPSVFREPLSLQEHNVCKDQSLSTSFVLLKDYCHKGCELPIFFETPCGIKSGYLVTCFSFFGHSDYQDIFYR